MSDRLIGHFYAQSQELLVFNIHVVNIETDTTLLE